MICGGPIRGINYAKVFDFGINIFIAGLGRVLCACFSVPIWV